VKALRDAIILVVTKLRLIDSTLVVYQWENKNRLPDVLTSTNVPTSVVELKKYFSRAIPCSVGGICYLGVYLVHNSEMKEILAEIGYWMKEQTAGIFLRRLQAEKTAIVGWALYCTRQMDIDALTASIKQDLDIDVGICWRMISTGKRGKIPEGQQIKALHFEVPWKGHSEATKKLHAIYSSNNITDYPLQLKLRLVPEICTMVNKNAEAKADRLRLRQAAFVGSVLEMTTWEISSLDYVDPALGIDLRGMIKSIRSTASPEMPLFHSIDPHWDGNGCIVTHLPQFEEEAMACVAGLLPYLRHLVGPALHDKLFTMEAIKRSIGLYWDPKECCVVGASDGYLSFVEDNDKDHYDFTATFTNMSIATGTTAAASAAASTRPPVAGVAVHSTTDTDSVSTFGTIRVHPPGRPTDSSSITTGTSTSQCLYCDECHNNSTNSS